jgi:transposase
MMTRRQSLLALEDWLTRVEADDQPELHSLATGIRRDQQAVTARLALPYSSAMEGNVDKIKTIKRQMYGRAGFALLRKRVIPSPCVAPITKFAQEPDRWREMLMASVA